MVHPKGLHKKQPIPALQPFEIQEHSCTLQVRWNQRTVKLDSFTFPVTHLWNLYSNITKSCLNSAFRQITITNYSGSVIYIVTAVVLVNFYRTLFSD